MIARSRLLWIVPALFASAVFYPPLAVAAQDANPPVQQRSSPNQGFTIGGTAVNAITGMPVAQARISIARTIDRGKQISVLTSNNGHFEFLHLAAGKYSLQGTKNGFISAAYDQHEQFSTAIVTGTEYSTGSLVFRLTPMAVITGHVFDESGDPIRKAHVVLYLEDHRGGMKRITRVASSESDDRGYYDFADLRPGKYFISVSAKPWYAVHPGPSSRNGGLTSQPSVSSSLDVVYPTTYYGGSTESDSATPIDLNGGDQQQIELRLNPTAALHLIYRVQNDRPEQFNMLLLQKRVFDSVEFEQPESTEPVSPGVYEITGIPQGRYTVRMRNGNSGQLEQGSDVDLARDSQEVDLSHSDPLGSLKLTVKLPGDVPLPKQFAIALQDSKQQVVAFRQPLPSGQFFFEDLEPGKYSILVASSEKPYSVVRTSSASGESAGHEITIASGAALEMTATLSSGIVSIEGVVHKKDKPVAGVMVALVPKDPEAHIELFRRDQSDFDGTFLLRGVIPGSYTIVAVEDAWDFEWLKPGALARYVQHGQELTIGELMSGSVHLPDPVQVQPH